MKKQFRLVSIPVLLVFFTIASTALSQDSFKIEDQSLKDTEAALLNALKEGFAQNQQSALNSVEDDSAFQKISLVTPAEAKIEPVTPPPAELPVFANAEETKTEVAQEPAPETKVAPASIVEKASIAADTAKYQALEKSLRATITAQDKDLRNVRAENQKLKQQLTSSSDRLAELANKIETQRNQLIMAEAEVSRLSSLMQDVNRQSMSKLTGTTSPVTRSVSTTQRSIPLAQQTHPLAQTGKVTHEMQVATVTAKKAYLRTGPGKDNSPLMSVSSGTRLAIETRQGEWYRVISPTGARAWVSAKVVAFGHNAFSKPGEVVQIKGYRSGDEDAAIELIRQGPR